MEKGYKGDANLLGEFFRGYASAIFEGGDEDEEKDNRNSPN
ncbi:MAG: hypothetical protein ACREOW_04810 [Thermodesulfobacteriota bacterium]